ncbi:MAG TPA: histidine--tRNA ligase [Gammaproteobacteria bacterium]|nr:histidine--tRNA ligase [Gammaproteobacteria bacterium]
MSAKLQSVRGMRDILPEQSIVWQHLEQQVFTCAHQYGYQEIRLPLLEKTELFKRSIGEVTDIVEKEMYTFEDRNGDSLSLRPEGTASCVRAALQHGLLHNQTQRLFYLGPMFRHERPQKGRYRQFSQVGFETFGFPNAFIDAELIMLSARLWRALGLADRVKLEINSLGSNEERAAFRSQLVGYFKQHQSDLDDESIRRLNSNPLRILDSKNPDMSELIASAPSLLDALGTESLAHFQQLRELLDLADLQYRVNPCLVRGLDYYCHTVFEWVTDDLGAQGTVCAGGRYDGLVTQLGGKPCAASGMAMGLDRLVELLSELSLVPAAQSADLFMVTLGDEAMGASLLLAEALRNQAPHLKVVHPGVSTSAKAQFKKADQSGAELALILGAEEIEQQLVAVKFLKSLEPQKSLPQSELVTFLKDYFKAHAN